MSQPSSHPQQTETKTAPESERRRRLARPRTLVTLGVLFLLMPVLNYGAAAYRFDLDLADVSRVLGVFARADQGYVGLIALLAPLLVGAGILSVRAWGWYTFLVYASGLALYNVAVLVQRPDVYNLAANGQTLFTLIAAGYLLQRDIFAPYMNPGRRGWRGQRRLSLAISVVVDGRQLQTRDVSASGCYVSWPDCPLAPGSEVAIAFRLGEGDFQLRGGVVRLDAAGIGIAFRNLDATARRALCVALDRAPRGLEAAPATAPAR
jgi:hypothetical protein